MDFTKQVTNQEIAEDEVIVSFDVVSLFTAIPVDKACDYIRKKLDENTTLQSFLPLKSWWECSLSGQTHQTPKMASQSYHTSKVSLNHLKEFLTTTASEPPPGRLRPCNRNLRLPNQVLHQIGKRTLSIKSPVWTAHGITSEKRVDACTLEKKEHIRNTKVFKSGYNITSHARLEGHTIDFENACVIDRGNSRVRKTLESWHTAITSQAENNSKQLPRQYSILL